MAKVNAASAKLSVDILDSSSGTNAIPGVDLLLVGNAPAVLLHLTRNKDALKAGKPAAEAAAISITATVDVQLGPQENLSAWKFHFIQLAKTTSDQWVFSGRQESEGTSMVNMAIPPLVDARDACDYWLDSETGLMPFTNLSAPAIFSKLPGKPTDVVNVMTSMDDHPSKRMPLIMPNAVTKAENLLVRGIRAFDALTAFVAVDNRGTIQTLAHVEWHIYWRAVFDWHNDVCRAFLVEKRFTIDEVVKGPPADADLARKITSPTRDPDKTYNAIMATARQRWGNLKAGEGSPAAANDSPKWMRGTLPGPVIPHI